MKLLDHAPTTLDVSTAVAVFRYELDPGDRFGPHDHPEHQLSWSPTGVLVAEVGDVHWELPTTLALWVPGGLPHDVGARRSAELHNVKFNPARCPARWSNPTVVAATPLLCALARHLADDDLPLGARRRAEAVLIDQLHPMTAPRVTVPLPADPRALAVARGLIADPAAARTLREWGAAVGASERTLVRCFAEGVGTSFTRWRTLVRIRHAMGLLAEGVPTGVVASRVGFRDVSSFIESFQRLVGTTPGRFATRSPYAE